MGFSGLLVGREWRLIWQVHLNQPYEKSIAQTIHGWYIFPTFTINISKMWVNNDKYTIHGWCTVRIFPVAIGHFPNTQRRRLPLLKRRMPRPQAFRKRRQAATSGLNFFKKGTSFHLIHKWISCDLSKICFIAWFSSCAFYLLIDFVVFYIFLHSIV